MKALSQLIFGTPEYVIEHGKRQLHRKRKLSAVLLGIYQIRNPEKAFVIAEKALKARSKKSRLSILNARGQTHLEEMLGIPPPWEAPWPGAQRVPHTCYEWY